MNPTLKRTLVLILKVVVLTFVLMVLLGIASSWLPAWDEGAQPAAGPGPQPSGNFLAVVVMVLGVQVLALAFPVVRSAWSGWRLVATVFLLHFGTATFLNQIETAVYLPDKMPDGFVAALVAMGLVTAALFAPIAVFTFGRWRNPSPPDLTRPATGVDLGRGAWRVPAAAVLFVALYYLFGYYVAWRSPELRAYYGGTDPSSLLAHLTDIVRATPWMLPLQLLRGLGWVALGLLAVRSMRGPWWQRGLATALLFAAPCFQLLLPNPLLPEAVTRIHFIETLPYQFLFGLFLGWFFRERAKSRGQAKRLTDK